MSKYQVFKCDRCEKEEKNMNIVASWARYDITGVCSTGRYIGGDTLCKECITALREWFKPATTA